MGRKLLAQGMRGGNVKDVLCTIDQRSGLCSVAMAEQRVDDDEDHHRAEASATELLCSIAGNEGFEESVHDIRSG